MTAFEREIKAFLCVVGIVKYDVFAPHYPKFFTEFERYTVSKSTLDNLYKEKYKQLRRGMATKLARRLQYFLDGDKTIKTPADLAERLAGCGSVSISFLRLEKGRFSVSIPALISLYGRPGTAQPSEQQTTGDVQPDSDRTVLAITLPTPLEAVTSEQQEKLIDGLLAIIKATQPTRFIERLAERLAESVGFVLVRAVTEGCTTINIEVTKAEAEQILRAFNDGQLAEAGVMAVDEMKASAPGLRPSARSPAIDPTAANARELFAHAWRMAARREMFIRPWRRLRWLFSPSVRLSPLAHVIGESNQRAYAAARLLPERWKSLAIDLSMTAMLWPLFTAILLALTLAPLRLAFPYLALEIGIVTGVILSLAGAQVCASVVSPIAVGAGSIVMGWSFGLAHAFAIGRFGSSGPLSPFSGISVRSDMFMAVVGGPIGLSAPGWLNNFPPLVIVFLLAVMATAMATTGWLMAQPGIAAGISAPPSDSVGDSGIVGRWLHRLRNHPNFAGIGCGILAGGCIGLVYGFTQALAPVFQQFEAEPTESFVAAFGLIGGLVFGTTTWARTRSARKGSAFGVLHACFAVALCFLVIHAPDGVARLIALSAASAYFHATWFTAAFVLGEQIGSARSAVVATTVEGAVGFTVFVIFRMIHG